MSLIGTSRYIALILRHKPETIDIKLDEHGWARVDELLEGVSKTHHPLTMEMLEKIVEIDDKQRFAFNEEKTLIRANQGHSVSVDVELKEAVPPKILYHGTAEKYVASIDQAGLIPKARLYVHLSETVETATKVGSRHGKPVVYTVDTESMSNDGYVFYMSANGVWLTKAVPVEYLMKIKH
ncbi:MAG: RNA 2'-phosphotransferase [Clostridia bacterium]|nr:RNA 2'-phosphotransferase [Clostridia bacterium]